MRWEFHPEALEEYRETTLYYAERDPIANRATRFVVAEARSLQCPVPENA